MSGRVDKILETIDEALSDGELDDLLCVPEGHKRVCWLCYGKRFGDELGEATTPLDLCEEHYEWLKEGCADG